MTRTINIGTQDFERIRKNQNFYVDKTAFIKEWWEEQDDVTLITRPRRFGKTLNMDMLNCFFSLNYRSRGEELFGGLDIWKEEFYRRLQGTYPVIALSFANIKAARAETAIAEICRLLNRYYMTHAFLLESEKLNRFEKKRIEHYCEGISRDEAADALNFLSAMLASHYEKKVLIFLDEYDTPLQEAYINGYWDEMSEFIRALFNSAFKTNPSMERAIMTGITRISKESIFSDLNNLSVVTTTSRQYQTAFGFTEEEVFRALDEYGMSDRRGDVKEWYDGFTFGRETDIYNPWSIINFLKTRELAPYWANTSSNHLISQELLKADGSIKQQMAELLNGDTLETEIDEQAAFSRLEENPRALWSLFLAGGYLKVTERIFDGTYYQYRLVLTNKEVNIMFRSLIREWFEPVWQPYSVFTKSLQEGDTETVSYCLNKILLGSASYFDTGRKTGDGYDPENFYHGLVLGLVATQQDYRITSNRESGLGRYDVMMQPERADMPGIIIEFKVFREEEKTLAETAKRALRQIEEKKYDTVLRQEDIIHYGFAFRGKEAFVLKA